MSFRTGIILFSILFLSAAVFAQPTLPAFNIQSKSGIVMLSWVNPYTSGVKAITVQRSADSLSNFSDIGVVTKRSDKKQVFVDPQPQVGHNYYRILLLFSSDVEWKSNIQGLYLDSSSIANKKQIPVSDSLDKIVEQIQESNINENAAIQEIESLAIKQSQYVFSNPFNGNINIELSDATEQHYKLDFFNAKNQRILNIPRIREAVVILDRRNFQNAGAYTFKLYKNNQIFEEGSIVIY